VANVIYANIVDRRGRDILSIRDQNTFDPALRRKRLMILLQLFLIHRYKVVSVHYVSPNEDNQHQTEKMKEYGIFDSVNTEVGQIIVGSVSSERVEQLVEQDSFELQKLIAK